MPLSNHILLGLWFDLSKIFQKASVFVIFLSFKGITQILSIKGECTFLLLKFLMIGLCIYSANLLLGIFLISPTEVFYQNIYKQLKQVHVDIHPILDL